MAKIQLSDYGHVAYQIKKSDACGNMVANILPLDTPPRTLTRLRGYIHLLFACQKGYFVRGFFLYIRCEMGSLIIDATAICGFYYIYSRIDK